LWAAHERESDVLYIYSEVVMPRHELAIVADTVKKRAGWVPGLFDHLARGRSQQEGQRIIDALLDLHLDVFTSHVDPDAGVAEVTRRLSTKRLKVFDTCLDWWSQYRSYRRDKTGEIVEESDGLMRATHLLCADAPRLAVDDMQALGDVEVGDAGRSAVTGY
jgi:hypothetical protein